MNLPQIFLLLAVAASLVSSCASRTASDKTDKTAFVSVNDTHFENCGKNYYYIGANIAPELLISAGQKQVGDILDSLMSMGINNVRILASETDEQKLDMLIDGMSSRDMKAVVCLTKSWDSDAANRIRGIVSRTNAISGKAYTDDSTIMAWQICNEPQSTASTDDMFVEWMQNMAALIKSIDGNHLVSTGIGGISGCHNDVQLYYDIHSDVNIDYLTIHIWPSSWRQAAVDTNISEINERTMSYIEEHMSMAQRLSKPMVADAFGLPVGNGISKGMRDEYTQFIFDVLAEQTAAHGNLTGCNFWKWCGDSEYGPYSISANDSTPHIIRRATAQIAACL